MSTAKRIGVFGWGIVAPGASDVNTFADVMTRSESHLRPFDGFGPSNFLVGEPEFDFAEYKPWIDARFPPSKYAQLGKKFGKQTLYGVAAFIQSLGQNEGVEAELRALGRHAQVIIGAGLHEIVVYDQIGRDLDRAQRRWERFWSQPERNAALRAHLAGDVDPAAPKDPRDVPEDERFDAEIAWYAHWARRSPELASYVAELRDIEAVGLEGDIATAKAVVLKHKQRAIRDLRAKWNAPSAPWDDVPADALWNITSSTAAQVSMLGHVTGMMFAPVAACSAFGYSLKLGIEAIRRGEAKLVVVGASEPAPNPISVGTFYNARVLAHDGEVSKPLTGMKGTHVAGGAAVWIIGDLEYYVAKGWKPLGLEPLAVGVTADADHIITPSKEGPQEAIRMALEEVGARAEDMVEFDMHATGTPGDYNEVELLREVLPATCRLSARKGTFGHGMGAGGGWELTAQYMGVTRGEMFPTTIAAAEVNPALRAMHDTYVLDEPCAARRGLVGKLSMGVGGINACVLSRPYDER